MFLKKRTAVLLTLAVVTGSVSGLVISNRVLAESEQSLYSQLRLFNRVLELVQQNYVDEVDPKPLIEGAITGMLEKLDPHSTYVDADRFQRMNERNQGEYFGIGVSFDIREGYITVISPIENSPSDRLGIRSGDRIIKIDGVSAKGISQEEVYDKLRGPKGSKVHVTVSRPGMDELLEFDIIRDKIPIYSVPYKFMLDAQTGYVRATRFSATTSQELEAAVDSLESAGMKRLIFDLRGNSGGYLNQAIEVADKFLPGGKVVVYTKGRIPDSSQYYYSTDNDEHPQFPVIVLVDHGSASASEIVAGAVQDHDRGLICGMTTFGKGLVQRQYTLRDGSALLLTVAHYFTPSGRLIQRPYGERDEYASDEAIEAAEQKTDEEVKEVEKGDPKVESFKTARGRTVFGGGGIRPDIKITYTRKFTDLQAKLEQNQVFSDVAPKLATQRGMKKSDDFEAFLKTWQADETTIATVKTQAESEKISFPADAWKADNAYIRQALKREVARTVWGDTQRYRVAIQDDEMLSQALTHFPEAVTMARTAETGAPAQR